MAVEERNLQSLLMFIPAMIAIFASVLASWVEVATRPDKN